MAKYKNEFLNKLHAYDKTKNALIFDDKVYTYEELLNTTDNYITKLKDMTYQSVAIVGDFSFDNIAFMLACIECKLNIIPLTKDSQTNEKISESKAILIFEDNHLKILNNHQKHKLIENMNAKNDSALILFSSGSTGKPKAIVHSLNNITMSYQDKKIKVINILLFLMFDHIGGINTLFNTLATSSCGIIVKERKNIDFIAKAIEKYKISILPASPSFLNLFLMSNTIKKYNLNSLRMITYGTEKMPDALLERLKIAFPKIRFHQTFGTSEVGITQTSTYKDFIKLENVDYKIINDELYIKSKTQSLGYLNADNSSFTDDGYFATGDLVETCIYNNEEYIKIIGRNKEVINVGGEKVLPSEVEGVILMMNYIKDCLVYKKDCPIMGNSVAVDVVLSDNLSISNLELKKQIKHFCKDKLAAYKIPTKVKIVENLEISDRFKKVRKI